MAYHLHRNIVVASGTLAVVALMYFLIPGYRWAVEEVGFKNLNLIQKIEQKRKRENLPPLNVHEKRAFKIENYYYLQLLNSSLPENAVVLLPPNEVVKNSRHEFLSEAEWVAYFIYPRLCVGEDDKNNLPELYKKITHVAIVNGWGYEKLSYKVPDDERVDETVLPILKSYD